MNLNTRKKLGLGSFLAILGTLGVVFGALGGWSSIDRPWSFVLGFAFGVLTGLGATLAISGLIDQRSGR